MSEKMMLTMPEAAKLTGIGLQKLKKVQLAISLYTLN